MTLIRQQKYTVELTSATNDFMRLTTSKNQRKHQDEHTQKHRLCWICEKPGRKILRKIYCRIVDAVTGKFRIHTNIVQAILPGEQHYPKNNIPKITMGCTSERTAG